MTGVGSKVAGVSWIVAGGFAVWAAARLPTTFFPEIDESMGTIYVRFAPGI